MCFPVAAGWKSLIGSAWAEFAALKCPKLQENMEMAECFKVNSGMTHLNYSF